VSNEKNPGLQEATIRIPIKQPVDIGRSQGFFVAQAKNIFLLVWGVCGVFWPPKQSQRPFFLQQNFSCRKIPVDKNIRHFPGTFKL